MWMWFLKHEMLLQGFEDTYDSPHSILTHFLETTTTAMKINYFSSLSSRFF